MCVVDIDMCEIKKVHSEHILLHFSREDLCNIFHIVVVIICITKPYLNFFCIISFDVYHTSLSSIAGINV